MDTYEIGHTFVDSYPPKAAAWCNSNGAVIVELDRQDNHRVFRIQEIPEPTKEEISKERIAELKAYLVKTDYVAMKLSEVEGEERTEMLNTYADVLAKRRAAREEINRLEEELNA